MLGYGRASTSAMRMRMDRSWGGRSPGSWSGISSSKSTDQETLLDCIRIKDLSLVCRMSSAANLESIMSDVIGQNNATVDVAAVQQAVDAGGTVNLHGTFNFVDVRLPGPLGSRVILVIGAVTIRGQNGTILGGGSAAPGGLQAVFFIDAPGADVTIEAIRFVNPHNAAIRVTRSGDLTIGNCQVEGLTPSGHHRARRCHNDRRRKRHPDRQRDWDGGAGRLPAAAASSCCCLTSKMASMSAQGMPELSPA
jgi:hypothetical protein